MRQAGRYLPEYRETRAKAGDFLTLCKTPELALEVTLQPLARFDLDAAILFSDILTIPDAMGLGLRLDEGIGPQFNHPVKSGDIAGLERPDPLRDTGYVMAAIRQIKSELADKLPLIGFAGSPWTLATYMVEGGSSRDFTKIKALAYQSPEAAHQLLSLLASAVSDYLNAQVDAGVDAVMIFDSWAGVLSPDAYKEFSLQYLAQIIDDLSDAVPNIVFCKGANHSIAEQVKIGPSALGLDWTIELGVARRLVDGRVALQGNLDPAIMLTDSATIERETQRVLQSYGGGAGHIFNLGHGITPNVPPENVKTLVDCVHRYETGKSNS